MTSEDQTSSSAPTPSSSAAKQGSPMRTTPLVESLRPLSSEERYQKIHNLIAEKVAEICGLDGAGSVDDKAGFRELGMDSLMGFELEGDLEAAVGFNLEETTILEYPNVSSLAGYLNERLFPGSRSSVATGTPTAASQKPAEAVGDGVPVEDMSDTEVENALRSELEAVEKMGQRNP